MAKFNSYPFWTARFWHGMRLRDWLRLLGSQKYRIHPLRWPLAATVTSTTVLNSLGASAQAMWYSKRIRETQLERPPVFIIGHWRSGTTMLHELMVCDERFNFPTTYQCIAPHHFLLSHWWATRLLWFLVPKQRPMDNMKAGMHLPQEDEFALMNLGCPSPYRRMAFPNESPVDLEYLDMEDIGSRPLADWAHSLLWFAKTLSYFRKGQLVFKSPTHTGRVKVLAKLFPGAKFIHIARHPYSLFPSTMRLWRALDTVQGLQLPKAEQDEADRQRREDYVLQCLERMYASFDEQCSRLAEDQFFEVRYEDLVQHPESTLASIYETLGLEDFEVARPAVSSYLSQRKDYRANPHPELDERIKTSIQDRWANYAARYGYEL
ncbi:MAG: sulfotransferase [Planctomycetales bacterium]|nr:sulfotransferase [Planctomycetales bacterium]